jgi:hypothetical protein
MQQGLFPCSPVHPALAVSVEMLEFVSTLFLHLAPNETAWTDTLVTFLARRGHVFGAQDSLRRRFSSALCQFQVLVRVVNAEMEKQISAARHEILSHNPVDWNNVAPLLALPKVDGIMPITARTYVSALSPDGRSPQGPTVSASSSCVEGNVNEPPISVSDYLRSRCPLCFGGMSETPESNL